MVIGLSAATWPLWRSWFIVALVAVELYVILAFIRGRTGRTAGSLAMRIVAIQADAMWTPGLRRQAVRSAIFGLLHVTVVGPLITLLVTRDGRDWIDHIAGTASVSLKPVVALPATRLDPYGRLTAALPGVAVANHPGQAATHDVGMTAGFAETPAPLAPNSSTGARQSVPGIMRTPRRGLPPTDPGHDLPAQPASPVDQATGPDGFLPPAANQPPQPPGFPPAQPFNSFAPPSGTTTTHFALIADTGERADLDAIPTVIGRDPSPTGGEHVLVLADPSMSMSRTHARVGVDARGVWVEDAYSANGTSFVQPDGQVVPLARGQRHYIAVGCTLLIGDRTVTVVPSA